MTPTLQDTLAAAVLYVEKLDRHDRETQDLLHDLRNHQMIFTYGATPQMPWSRPTPSFPPKL